MWLHSWNSCFQHKVVEGKGNSTNNQTSAAIGRHSFCQRLTAGKFKSERELSANNLSTQQILDYCKNVEKAYDAKIMKTSSTFATVAAGFLCLLVEQVLSATTEYKVVTKTGDESDAGTEAKVYIRIYDINDAYTREKQLKKGFFGFKPFRKGRQDSFELEAKALGKLKKITIRHDNKGRDPSWYLETVTIEVGGNIYHFPCQCWLDTRKWEGISRTVYAAAPEVPREEMYYKVTTETGDKFLAGTNANVFVTIYGENDHTREIKLKKTGFGRFKNNFEKGNKDSFSVKAKHLGKLIKIVIRHDNSGIFPEWFLNKVKIRVNGVTYTFPCNCWLDKDQGNMDTIRQIYEERVVPPATTPTQAKLGTSPPTQATLGTSPSTTAQSTTPSTQASQVTIVPTEPVTSQPAETTPPAGTTAVSTQAPTSGPAPATSPPAETTPTAGTTAVSTQPPTSGPAPGALSYSAAQYYWPFDEHRGRITPDMNGGKYATLGGNAQLVPSMRRPMVAATSGDVITLGDFQGTCFSDPTPCTSTGITVMFWLELKRSDIYKVPLHDRYIVSSGAQTKQARGFFLAARPNFGLYIEVVTADVRWVSLIPEDRVPENWSNFAFSWSADQGLHVFINGEEAGEVQFSNAVAERPEDKFTIITINKPNHKDNEGYQTNFKMDDLAFFSRYLTGDEIKQVLSNSMQATQAPPAGTATAIPVVTPFSETSAGTTAKPKGGSPASKGVFRPTSASTGPGGSTTGTASSKPSGGSSGPGATGGTTSTPTTPPVATAKSGATPPAAAGINAKAAAAVRRGVSKAVGLLRGMHSASPVVIDPKLNDAAQERVEQLGVAKRAEFNTDAKYGTNICINDGPMEELAAKCAAQWYSKVKDYDWLMPRLTPSVQPFVQLVWRANKRLGVGISKTSSGKYVLVVLFESSANQHALTQNVWPTEDVFEPTLQSKCPENYKQVGQTCFTYHGTPQTWENAVLGCALEGAVLWTLNSAQEENTVKSIIATSSTDSVWLGIHDRPREGHFMSVSGRPVEYLNWYPYEPNGGVGENCVSMTTTTYAGSWADRKCSDERSFICRKPLPGIVSYSLELRISGRPQAQPQPYVMQVQLQNPYSGYRKNTVIRDIHAAITETLERVYSGQGLFMTPHLETLITDPAGNSTAHVILKFGPNVGDSSLQPLRDYLEKNGGKFPGLNENVTVVSYDLIRPGTGACTYQCFASCTPECQPTCCSTRSSLPAQTAPVAPYLRPRASRVYPAPLPYLYRFPAPYVYQPPLAYRYPERPYPYPARSYFRLRLGSARDTIPAVAHAQIPHHYPEVARHAYQTNGAKRFPGIQYPAGSNGCIMECRRPQANPYCPAYCPKHCCTNAPIRILKRK